MDNNWASAELSHWPWTKITVDVFGRLGLVLWGCPEFCVACYCIFHKNVIHLSLDNRLHIFSQALIVMSITSHQVTFSDYSPIPLHAYIIIKLHSRPFFKCWLVIHSLPFFLYYQGPSTLSGCTWCSDYLYSPVSIAIVNGKTMSGCIRG